MRCCKGNYAFYVKINMPAPGQEWEAVSWDNSTVYAVTMRITQDKWLDTSRMYGIIIFTLRLTVPRGAYVREGSQTGALRQQGTLNPRSREVTDPLFAEDSFFDAAISSRSSTRCCARAEREPLGDRGGDRFRLLAALVLSSAVRLPGGGAGRPGSHKRGPKQAHKLTDELLAFLVATRQKEPAVRTPELARLLQERFGTKVHPRSIERSLLRRQKKLR